MSQEWWQTFFDRTYTRSWAEAGCFDHTAAEVAGVLALLDHDPSGPPMRILDVPCGFGRHAMALHRAGHDVVGVDLSSDQLAIAERDHPGPRYLRDDMRMPPDGPFDVVLNLFSSIGYFAGPTQADPAVPRQGGDEQDLVALRAWHDVLAPGGRLVIETNHRDRIAVIHSPGEELPVGATGAVEFGEMDWVAGVMDRVVRFADGSERTFRVRLYTVTELVALVRRAGFARVEVHGGLQAEPVSPQSRLVLLATRP